MSSRPTVANKLVRRVILLFVCFLFTQSLINAQETITINGIVKDAVSGAPLPYSSISLKNTYTGVTADEKGQFKLKVQIASLTDSLEVNYLGYEPLTSTITEIRENSLVLLTPSIFTFDEVVIRPLTPEELLLRVCRKIDQNYAQFSFNTLAHYEEVIKENSSLIDHSEAVFRSWFKEFQDKGENEHQLALYREKDTQELQFMKERAEKEKRKYLKENPDAQDRSEDDDLLLANFGGPNSIMNLNVVNNSLDCLDTLIQNKFKFRYLPESSYQDNVLIVIEYESKGKLEYRKQRGRLFIDSTTEAIVKVEEQGEIIMPAIVKPILFALGLRIRKPTYNFDIKYRKIEDRWYPEYSKWDVQLDLTKKHAFKKNQRSLFDIEQHYIIYDITTNPVKRIDEDKAFVPSQKMSDQLHPINGVEWDTIEN